MRKKIGVYVCHCGVNISATVDIEKVCKLASGLPGVAAAKDYTYLCSDPGQELIKKDIKELGLEKVVIAACSPRMHEQTFRGACEEAELNPYCLEMANIREQCSWVHKEKDKATRKAAALISASVAKASLLEPLSEKEVDVIPKALVIGGGISGIQSSLDIADAGFGVYLVEKDPSIGGHMAQLDKTFPTLDCSACILTPKMVDVYRHPNIELLTYCEVISVDGFIGNFKVKVRKKPRYVNINKCNGCGACAEACLLKGRIASEFEAGMGKRGAIYVPFPQAVPLVYTVDSEKCLFLRKGKCGKSPACKAACGPEAIDFEQKEEIIELEIGTIIVATGFDVFPAKEKPEYGYDAYSNVITGLEFERLSSASGPTFGKIKIGGKEPEDVVFIQCVGSRDKELGNEYCSRVCCMYTAKQAHLVREKLPNANITVFYIDVRAFGKGFEEFYDRVKKEGIIYRRGNASEVYRRGEKLIVRAEDTLLGEALEVETDLVVLSTGLVQRDVGELKNALRLSQSSDRFFLEAHPKLRPMDTATAGVYLAGCCQGPKDIPDSVAQASGAAAKAIVPLATGKVKIDPIISFVDENICRGCGICITTCPYDAIELKEITRDGYPVEVAFVNDVLCKGCGACVASCLSGAIQQRSFTDEQILSQITALGVE
ncbi:MAG: Electron transport complex subunit RsxB [Syntrophomonadaceae bacterium]|nr:Electron transport complex subunit RsxB [Bacillota bacterium]